MFKKIFNILLSSNTNTFTNNQKNKSLFSSTIRNLEEQKIYYTLELKNLNLKYTEDYMIKIIKKELENTRKKNDELNEWFSNYIIDLNKKYNKPLPIKYKVNTIISSNDVYHLINGINTTSLEDAIIKLDNNEQLEYLVNYKEKVKNTFHCDVKELYKINEISNLEEMIEVIKEIETLILENRNIYSDIIDNLPISIKSKEYSQILEQYKIYIEQRSKEINFLKKSLQIGKDGEDRIDEYLKPYDDEIINLSGVRLEVEGNSIENDNILITRRGIFVLEVKNIGSTGSYNIKIEKDGRWTKEFTNGKSEVINFDATTQNDRHVVYLKRFINKKLNRDIDNYIDIEGLVIIANNIINIKNYSEQPVYRMQEIYRHISKHNILFSGKEMLEIKNIIIQNSLPPKKVNIIDYYKELINNIESIRYISDSNSINYANDILTIMKTYLKRKEDILYTLDFNNEYHDYLKRKSNIEFRINQIDLLIEEFKNNNI